ncbi:MAG: zinc ribbon domain-containing protein [Pseudomonadota bacterium]
MQASRRADPSPSDFFGWPTEEANLHRPVETGGLWLETPTAKLKPSQTCPACGAQQKKALAQRWHCCHRCGHEEDRDSAAARVVLCWALGTIESGREPAREAA